MLSVIKNILWGIPTLSLLVVAGVYFTFKCGIYRPKSFLSVIHGISHSLKSKSAGGISSLSAVATALGGTVGVGSIVGVGYAISVGGAGSVFWMWVCSFFGMGLKYAEVYTALKSRVSCDGQKLGGAPFRLRAMGFPKTACLFCVFCIAASFGTGNLTQVGAITSFLSASDIPQICCVLICVTIIAFAVFGGRERIARLNTFIVPAASVAYILICIALLVINASAIPSAFVSVFREAFGFSALTGGFSGALMAKVLREGFARSIFSNEAGMGSSPLAHASAENTDADTQSKWGIFEVFFDTFLVSTLTALCLLSGNYPSPEAMFTSLFGACGGYIFGGLCAVFAFASIISWCYYAQCCIAFMFPEKAFAQKLYRVIFALAAIPGVLLSANALWEISDILNALMMFPNLFLLYKCRNDIERMK